MSGLASLFVTRDGSSNGTTPKGARHALGGFLLQAGDALLNARKGVLMDNGSANVVTGHTDMSFNIRAAVFVGQSSTAQGPWVGANDATVNVVTDPAPGSNSRYDVIWVRQHLVAGDGGADSDVILEFGVEKGVVAASPAVPATPTGAVKLAEALVTAGMTATNTATITQKFDWTVARGGVLPIFTAAQLASLTPHTGQVIYDNTEGVVKVWEGAAWAQLARGVESVQVGASAATVTTSLTVITATLSVPARPYPRRLELHGAAMCTALTGSYWQVELYKGAAAFGGPKFRGTGPNDSGSLVAVDTLAAGVAATYHLRALTGSGTATVVSDSSFTYLTAIIHPDR